MENKNVEVIPFTSRYGDKYFLTLVGHNTYKANIGEYYRVGLSENDNNNEYTFVDPSGGPFIEVGRVFPYNGRIVKTIKPREEDKALLIEFEE